MRAAGPAALKAPRTHASATGITVAIERIRESIERIVLPPGPLPLACRPAPVKPEHVTTPPAAPRRRDYEPGGRLLTRCSGRSVVTRDETAAESATTG